MKKRLISMLLTAGMLVSLVAGCGSKAETPGASGDSNAAGTETASTNGEYPVIRVPYSIVFDSFDADKVEDALNEIMREKAGAEIELVGIEFANYFKDKHFTKIVTIESSGIAPAVFAGLKMNLPVIFLKKSEPSTMKDPVYTEAFSFTKNRKYTLCMERSCLNPEDSVLFIDDFLANGQAFISAEDLVHQCNAKIDGIGIVIEKSFQKGRQLIEEKGYDIYSLARIQEMKDNKIVWTK